MYCNVSSIWTTQIHNNNNMFQNIQLDKIISTNIHDRLTAIASHRNKSQTKPSTNPKILDAQKFRMTQRLVKPSPTPHGKKIKSEALSPDQIRIHNIGTVDIRNQMRKSMTFRTETNNNNNNNNRNHFIFNPDFKFHVSGNGGGEGAGRTAALSNHSPEKVKIKTTGLMIDSIPTSIEKPMHEKFESKPKYVIHSTRKYSFNYDNKLSKNQRKVSQEGDQGPSKTQFTEFELEEIKKYHVYYKGKRRINNRGQFTDGQGFPLVDIGDAVAYRYEIIQQLGRGAFGKVYRAQDHKKKEQVALKIIRAIPKLNKQAKIQIQILQKSITKDPQNRNNIVRMKGSFVFRSHSCISYQLLSLNLYQYLKSNKFHSTPQPILIKFAIQILHSLAFLHANRIVHCDIKPENIMLKEQTKTGVKLIDLGSSCYQEQQFYTYIQSRYYRAPEVILGIRYTTAIDMWSLGCVLAEMHTGYPLFPGESQEDQLMMYIELLGMPPLGMLEQGTRRKRFFNDNYQCRIIQSSSKYRIPKGLTFEKALDNCQSKNFVEFIRKCIEWEPSKRITPKEALLHEWILSGIPANIRARHIVEVTGQELEF